MMVEVANEEIKRDNQNGEFARSSQVKVHTCHLQITPFFPLFSKVESPGRALSGSRPTSGFGNTSNLMRHMHQKP